MRVLRAVFYGKVCPAAFAGGRNLSYFSMKNAAGDCTAGNKWYKVRRMAEPGLCRFGTMEV
jgi:hypothetical protein